MRKEDILDYLVEDDSIIVQESFEYRILLTLLWLIWSAWSFYDGIFILDVIRNGQDLLGLVYHIGLVYDCCFISALTLGMAIVVFKKSENRIFYLFSFVGIILTRLLVWKINEGAMIVFLPMFFLLVLRNLRACLICYALSLLLYIFVSNNIFHEIKYRFINYKFLLFCSLIFMTAFIDRVRLFPLSTMIIKLRYRLSFLLGLLFFYINKMN
jgi:hypothetical protein